eukprot:TRINITY_DN11399_c0_g1_i1.p1 TRINITY_DN11399_c0_g1~~TRINITY_DN11399_c0_g1_i1.p1  ORF type:complete len:218 (-),score=12.28 TRINITY_DN11399_c0_g1_i1:24-677(-)
MTEDGAEIEGSEWAFSWALIATMVGLAIGTCVLSAMRRDVKLVRDVASGPVKGMVDRSTSPLPRPDPREHATRIPPATSPHLTLMGRANDVVQNHGNISVVRGTWSNFVLHEIPHTEFFRLEAGMSTNNRVYGTDHCGNTNMAFSMTHNLGDAPFEFHRNMRLTTFGNVISSNLTVSDDGKTLRIVVNVGPPPKMKHDWCIGGADVVDGIRVRFTGE